MEKLGQVLQSVNRQSLQTQTITSDNEPQVNKIDDRERLRKRLNLFSIDNTFANFKQVNGATNAYKAFKELATGSSWYMLLCLGATGCGKTHLCEALSLSLYKQGIISSVIKFNELVSIFKRALINDSSDYDSLFKRYKQMKYLILDDYGLGTKTTDYEISVLEEIIDYRYRERLPTVLTANLDLKDIPVRVASRFGDGETSRIIINRAGDYRPLKCKAKENY